MARPTKFTPEVREKVVTALRGGNYRKVAAEYAGITYTTLRNWLLLAEDPHAPPEYVQFLEDVTKAEADAEIVDIARIRQASADGSWQAAAWIRERKNPERWGKKDQATLAVTGADGGPLSIQHQIGADPAAIIALAAVLGNRFEERKDPLAQPIEVKGLPAPEPVDYEAHRVTPGELGKAIRPVQPIEEPPDAPEASEGLIVLPHNDDVEEFSARREAHIEAERTEEAFKEIVSDVEVSPEWGAWDDPGVETDKWDWDDED